MNTINLSGACLSGGVKVTVRDVVPQTGACHCGMCRKWGGGPFMTIDCGSEVSVSGEENGSIYSSSDWAERRFCKQCGSHLFYRLRESGQHFMPAGLFEQQALLAFDHQVFVDEKPRYYEFAQQTTMMTGAEVVAFFNGQD